MLKNSQWKLTNFRNIWTNLKKMAHRFPLPKSNPGQSISANNIVSWNTICVTIGTLALWLGKGNYVYPSGQYSPGQRQLHPWWLLSELLRLDGFGQTTLPVVLITSIIWHWLASFLFSRWRSYRIMMLLLGSAEDRHLDYWRRYSKLESSHYWLE